MKKYISAVTVLIKTMPFTIVMLLVLVVFTCSYEPDVDEGTTSLEDIEFSAPISEVSHGLSVIEEIESKVAVEEPVPEEVVKVNKTRQKFNAKQQRLLDLAREEGEAIGFPETIQAILLQETIAGLLGPVGDLSLGVGKRSYCHMQIKVQAARHAIQYNPDLGTFKTDEELIAKLITDDEFCIRVGARYFALLQSKTKTWKEAVLAYNRGLRGSRNGKDPMNYVQGISSKIRNVVRSYNAE